MNRNTIAKEIHESGLSLDDVQILLWYLSICTYMSEWSAFARSSYTSTGSQSYQYKRKWHVSEKLRDLSKGINHGKV